MSPPRGGLRRADDNVALSLEVFEGLFDQLAANDALPPPPLGRTGNEVAPARGPGFGPPPHGVAPGHPPRWRPPPPEFGDGPPDHPPPGEGPPPHRRGNPSGDTGLLESVLTFYERFARQNATDPGLQSEAAWAYRKVGVLYGRLGRTAEAENAYDRAIRMFEDLIKRHPDVASYRLRLVDTYDMADPWSVEPPALEPLRQRFETGPRPQRPARRRIPGRHGLRAGAGPRLREARRGAARSGRSAEAEAIYRRAIALEGVLVDARPGRNRPRTDRAITREALATLLLDRAHAPRRGRPSTRRPTTGTPWRRTAGCPRPLPIGWRAWPDCIGDSASRSAAEEVAGWAALAGEGPTGPADPGPARPPAD